MLVRPITKRPCRHSLLGVPEQSHYEKKMGPMMPPQKIPDPPKTINHKTSSVVRSREGKSAFCFKELVVCGDSYGLIAIKLSSLSRCSSIQSVEKKRSPPPPSYHPGPSDKTTFQTAEHNIERPPRNQICWLVVASSEWNCARYPAWRRRGLDGAPSSAQTASAG